MRRKYTRTRANRSTLCALCGLPVPDDFAFDWKPGVWVHPDCISFEMSDPSRKVVRGQRLVHTCGEPLCCNPEHLEVAR